MFGGTRSTIYLCAQENAMHAKMLMLWVLRECVEAMLCGGRVRSTSISTSGSACSRVLRLVPRADGQAGRHYLYRVLYSNHVRAGEQRAQG